MMHQWRRGRAVECTGLENRQGFIALREFESLRLRQIQKTPLSDDWGFLLRHHFSLFCHLCCEGIKMANDTCHRCFTHR